MSKITCPEFEGKSSPAGFEQKLKSKNQNIFFSYRKYQILYPTTWSARGQVPVFFSPKSLIHCTFFLLVADLAENKNRNKLINNSSNYSNGKDKGKSTRCETKLDL